MVAAVFPRRRRHPQGGAGRGVARAPAVGAEAAGHDGVRQVVRVVLVGREAADFGAEIKQRRGGVSVVIQLGAAVETVAGSLDVQSAAAIAQIVDADPEQLPLVNRRVRRAAGGAKTHVEDVHVVGPRGLAAHAEGIEIT